MKTLDTSSLAALATITLFTAACGGQLVDEEANDDTESVGVADEALVAPNALNPNALNPNVLNPNALNPNALNPNALNPNALSPSALTALGDPGSAGAASRQFVKYAVGCALDTSQSFSFSWVDALNIVHSETYPGLLGLAPSWATTGLDAEGEKWVSACLASRINWYGVSVMLSARGDHDALNDPDAEELADYTNEEGAFWGNLFSASPAVYACSNTANTAHSRARFRDCAVGHDGGLLGIQSCGPLTRVGSCDTYCDDVASGSGHRAGCGLAGGASTDAVVTVFLK